jgi:putative DNA primase/helicase
MSVSDVKTVNLYQGQDLYNASCFCDGRSLAYEAGIVYRWVHNHWSIYEEDVLFSEVANYLKFQVYTDSKGEVKPFPVTKKSVNNLIAMIPSFLIQKGNVLPTQKIGIPMLDGFFCLSRFRMIDHDKHNGNRYLVPAKYSKELPTKWLSFLSEAFSEFDDDEKAEDQIKLLQEWVGYLLSGETKYQKFMHLYGAAGTGKGTIIRIISEMMGSGAVPISVSALENKTKGSLALAINSTLAYNADVRFGGSADSKSVLETILKITGNDKVAIPLMHKNDWKGTLSCRLMFASNPPPRFSTPDSSIHRRLLILHTPRACKKVDYDLEKKLLLELGEIVSWAIEGYVRLIENDRFTMTDSMREELKAAHIESDSVLMFIDDSLEVDLELDQRGQFKYYIDISQIYRSYCEFCSEQKMYAKSQKEFKSSMKAALVPLGCSCPRASKAEKARAYGVREIFLRSDNLF